MGVCPWAARLAAVGGVLSAGRWAGWAGLSGRWLIEGRRG